ncbi:uncharacterized protein LOC129717095 [Wyeomyia smithii]|uniref:uncharacterized protein LOC129717095 n=1 Tax=Wyeomyia smithii TaxID=174621 RepID=UPI002468188B|nr:uncharacterized protein LOC129717095 [Wyeomyia smithii]
MANYYRRFIPMFSEMSTPLTNLLRKKPKTIVWNDEAEKAFIRIKESLVTSPVLSNPDFDLPFEVQTDLSPAQQAYAATEKEGLAVILAIEKFRPYIEGTHFVVITDASALTHIMKGKWRTSSRLSRWSIELQGYDLEIRHRRGRDNIIPDALSRAVEALEFKAGTDDNWYAGLLKRVEEAPDINLDYKIENGKLYKFVPTKTDVFDYRYEWKLCVPENFRYEILQTEHDNAFHIGYEKLLDKFKESNTITEVQIRLGKLEELWEAFSGTLVEIFSHDDYDAEGNAFEKERMEFSDRYYEAKSFLMDKTRELQAPQVLEQSSSAGDSSMRNGTDHEDLPEVEKFHYLKGCLQGEPKSLIDPLQITKANYQVAWDLLLKRYNNSKLLKKRQVISLFKLPMLSKESAMELNALVEEFEKIIQTLDQVVQLADFKDLLLVNFLTARLDPVTRRGWEEMSASREKDSLVDLLDFFHRKIQVLQCLPQRPVDNKGIQQHQPQQKQRALMTRTNCNSSQVSGGRCVACLSNHSLYQCNTFQHMNVADRDALLKSNSLCRNCFRAGHMAKDCQSKYSCQHQYSAKVLLATAVVIIEDDDGNRYPARALLDSGSESNFVTERLSQRLKVSRDRVEVSVLGIGHTTIKVKQKIRATIRSRISSFSRELSFLVLPKVTVNLPTSNINTERWEIPNGVQLADPTFFESKAVDLVLGIEAFFDFFETGRRISLGQHMPTLSESVFGWVACGGHTHQTQSLQIKCNLSAVDSLDKLITRFWSCEEIESGKALSLEEKRCGELQTIKRNPDGRYTVSLPKDEAILSRLGESRDIAFRRLQGMERRLARDESLHEQYTNFMQEYLQLGHMRKVEEAEVNTIKRCYLRHNPVVKESSTTTKVRVVFDASCKTTSGESLNDLLLVGPVIQEDLRSIILRSRAKQIMLVSDVEKMFRQIKVCQEDRPLQCILWRSSPIHDVDTYELNTVTYGTKPAPFLATRTLKQLAVDEKDNFPFAARAIMEDTYMDDVITGSDDPESARTLRVQLDSMRKKGGFRLRKWASNCSDVLSGIQKEKLAIQSSEEINLDPDPSIKTLGLTWMPVTDTLKFQFKIPILNPSVPLTKRNTLSVIATLFDPLGLLGAAITSAKTYMQLLWTLRDENGQRLNWDQSLPSTVGEIWIKYHQ